MNISDDHLRQRLRNVYWIGGGACGGKTTIADLLGEAHGLRVYHCEGEYLRHRELANERDQPAMMATHSPPEWFLGRSVEKYAESILDQFREQFEMVVRDLATAAEGAAAIAEGHLLDALRLKPLAPDNRTVFLFADGTTVRRTFFGRPDHRPVADAISRLDRPEQARENVLRVSERLSAWSRQRAEAAGMRTLLRADSTPVEDTLAAVEKHFGLR